MLPDMKQTDSQKQWVIDGQLKSEIRSLDASDGRNHSRHLQQTINLAPAVHTQGCRSETLSTYW